jgi:hypothetical protein
MELFHVLSSSAKRKNDNILGFNTASVDDLYDMDNNVSMSRNFYDFTGIKGSKSVMFVPLSGLINQDKYLPLRYMGGLTIELELVSDPTECLISDPYTCNGTASSQGENPLIPAVSSFEVLSVANISTNWTLSDLQIKCDVVTLDNNLNDEYVKYLLSGKSLAINYNTYISQLQTVAGQQNAVNITRSVSRLKSVFISHMGPLQPVDAILHKHFNTFYHPMSSGADNGGISLGVYDTSQEMEVQIQIGSRLFPEYPIRSVSEAFYNLLK